MVDASFQMRMEELLEGASEDYRHGFRDCYALMSERIDALTGINIARVDEALKESDARMRAIENKFGQGGNDNET